MAKWRRRRRRLIFQQSAPEDMRLFCCRQSSASYSSPKNLHKRATYSIVVALGEVKVGSNFLLRPWVDFENFLFCIQWQWWCCCCWWCWCWCFSFIVKCAICCSPFVCVIKRRAVKKRKFFSFHFWLQIFWRWVFFFVISWKKERSVKRTEDYMDHFV